MNFTLDQYQSAIRGTGRKCVRTGKGLVAQCLRHNERNPSMEVFADGWCQCYVKCGRFHISHLFPEFRDPDWKPDPNYRSMGPPSTKPVRQEEYAKEEEKREYKRYDLYDLWRSLPPIPRDHSFKTIPLDVLDGLGWRWTDGCEGMGGGYLIPYFNHDKTKVPFAQVRHLVGNRRFSFLPGAQIIVYGKWNLNPGERLFLVEGASDCAVLEYAMIPWIGIPSASSTTLVANLGRYCLKHGISLVYAGDNDDAGEKLREALDEVCPYRTKQPPKRYKDWGEFLVEEGVERVSAYCWEELAEPEVPPMVALAASEFLPQQSLL